MVLSQIQNIAVNGAGNSKAGLIAGLRQLSNTPEQRGKLILAVEGDNDIRFYGRFLNPDKITIHQSRGCRKVTMELRNLTPMQLSLVRSFLIVILDADGIRLPGARRTYSSQPAKPFFDREISHPGCTVGRGFAQLHKRKQLMLNHFRCKLNTL